MAHRIADPRIVRPALPGAPPSTAHSPGHPLGEDRDPLVSVVTSARGALGQRLPLLPPTGVPAAPAAHADAG
jgi:hypothetical protein